jgi:hypothetical protein
MARALQGQALCCAIYQQPAAVRMQEYYEVLHSCKAILPAFASDAYYVNKGSSSVAASFISGTPLVATPRLLQAYSFLDESAAIMVQEGMGDVEVCRRGLIWQAVRVSSTAPFHVRACPGAFLTLHA